MADYILTEAMNRLSIDIQSGDTVALPSIRTLDNEFAAYIEINGVGTVALTAAAGDLIEGLSSYTASGGVLYYLVHNGYGRWSVFATVTPAVVEAPVDAQYYVAAANGTLTNEVLLNTLNPLPVDKGGTGLAALPSANQLLGVNDGGTAYEGIAVSSGDGIDVLQTTNSLVISAADPVVQTISVDATAITGDIVIVTTAGIGPILPTAATPRILHIRNQSASDINLLPLGGQSICQNQGAGSVCAGSYAVAGGGGAILISNGTSQWDVVAAYEGLLGIKRGGTGLNVTDGMDKACRLFGFDGASSPYLAHGGLFGGAWTSRDGTASLTNNTHSLVGIGNTGGTITLPTPEEGKMFHLFRSSAGSNTITIAGVFSDGTSTKTLQTPQYSHLTLLGTDSRWFVISEEPTRESIQYQIDGNGAAIASGVKMDYVFPFSGVIEEVTLLADQSGSITVDLWKDTYANFPPTGADDITGGTSPAISAALKYQDSTLTGWTTSFTAGDILRINVPALATSITRLDVSLKVRRT